MSCSTSLSRDSSGLSLWIFRSMFLAMQNTSVSIRSKLCIAEQRCNASASPSRCFPLVRRMSFGVFRIGDRMHARKRLIEAFLSAARYTYCLMFPANSMCTRLAARTAEHPSAPMACAAVGTSGIRATAAAAAGFAAAAH